VFAGSGSYATPDSFSAGFGPAIGVSAALSLAGAIAGLALRMRPAQQSVSAGVVPASKPA
jgi:hypothetical protein